MCTSSEPATTRVAVLSFRLGSINLRHLRWLRLDMRDEVRYRTTLTSKRTKYPSLPALQLRRGWVNKDEVKVMEPSLKAKAPDVSFDRAISELAALTSPHALLAIIFTL